MTGVPSAALWRGGDGERMGKQRAGAGGRAAANGGSTSGGDGTGQERWWGGGGVQGRLGAEKERGREKEGRRRKRKRKGKKEKEKKGKREKEREMCRRDSRWQSVGSATTVASGGSFGGKRRT